MKPRLIIGRSVFATQLAFKCGCPRIVYDGRGAIAAEWQEYNVGGKEQVSQIADLEKECVLKSNYRIAVSEKLAEHWKNEYHYRSQEHAIIPCTLNRGFEKTALTEEAVSSSRKKLGFKEEDIVFAYSGSSAGWQSFELLKEFLKKELKANGRSCALFLSEKNKAIEELEKEFSQRIICKKVSPDQVPLYLMAADYGLLIREKSITNKVASPVKFAEYLACGLKVIISEDLGDFSDFVQKNNCGFIYTQSLNPGRISFPEKKSMHDLALRHFSKKAYSNAYKIIAALS